ncbi:oligosaccharide flippase family protein [Citrobacter braakii]|uniref:oligosaccharide flippase family protein n=1 Tax=Citrobacter braakii TaxID=57706 RepID=UPI001905B038|nr:oligosaccharide flippase family protein [Citrobacter braakii]MBJ9569763.1 oligosaccharide flippase family protein [Citrobacter braakii]
MKKSHFIYLSSIGIRGITLLSKFVFIILLAKLLQSSDLGIYGLISAAVGYAIFAIGFEFYTYSTREIINSKNDNLFFILKNQSFFYFLSYIFYIPIFFIIKYYSLLPEGSEYWFIAILFFEHIAQEINRILITLESQAFASLVLFIRQGLWCWIVIVIMLFFPSQRTLFVVFTLWLLGTFCASVTGVIYIFKNHKQYHKSQVSWHWIKKGIILSAPMLIAALALRGFFTFDRFTVEHISGLKILGAYTLFISMTAAIQSFLDTILISFSFPKLAKLCYRKEYVEFINGIKLFAIKLIVLSFLLCICCFFTGYILIKWIGKNEYFELLPLFQLLIIATFIYCLSLIPHLGLYALRKDKMIVWSQCLTFLLFLSFLYITLKVADINYIAYGMIISFTVLLFLKLAMFIKLLARIR